MPDGFGVEFEGAFDTRRLFLHETYPEDFHPLKKSFRNAPVMRKGQQSIRLMNTRSGS